MKTRVKGTMILKRGNRFFKIITVRGTGNKYVFECVDIDSKQRKIFTYEMLGLLEAFDAAASKMKDPKDILLVDRSIGPTISREEERSESLLNPQVDSSFAFSRKSIRLSRLLILRQK